MKKMWVAVVGKKKQKISTSCRTTTKDEFSKTHLSKAAMHARRHEKISRTEIPCTYSLFRKLLRNFATSKESESSFANGGQTAWTPQEVIQFHGGQIALKKKREERTSK